MSESVPGSAIKTAGLRSHFAEQYAVERVIGRGGMATVFEGRHLRLGDSVAIKVLAEDLRMHPELVRRFEREARAARSLSSPHAVRVFDIGRASDGAPFIVMELLSGKDLGQLIACEGPQPIGQSVRWIIEACDAIAEAHRLGIIHRDIKPANLLLCSSGSIKVLDFGIAKHVTSSEARITLGVAPLGTPQYMSPEQVRRPQDVDVRSDIWSLGVTLYELVTGRLPYPHDVPHACIAAIVLDPVPDPRGLRSDLPDDLAVTLMRALSKAPEDRFQTVDELVFALAPFADPPAVMDAYCLPVTSGVAPRRCDEKSCVKRRANLSRARVFMRGKRVRSSLAWASATVLGVTTLIATPRYVGSHDDQAASTATTQVKPTVAVGLSAIAPSSSVPSAHPPMPMMPPRPETSSPTRFSERLVHGGVSNPGF